MERSLKFKIWSNVILIFAFFFELCMVSYTTLHFFQIEVPAYYMVDLEGMGRILYSNEIHSGTFTINAPFDAIKGNNSIVGVQEIILMLGGKSVRLHAWIPDENTSGVFLYGEKEYSPDNIFENNWFLTISHTKIQDKKLIIFPKRNYFCLVWFLFVITLISFLFIVLSITIANKERNRYLRERFHAQHKNLIIC